MARYDDLTREQKLLANQLYSAATKAKTSGELMQAMVDEIAELGKQTDPEYQEFLRLQRKFPQG